MKYIWRRLRESITKQTDWELFKLMEVTKYIAGYKQRPDVYFDSVIHTLASAMKNNDIPANMPIADVIDLLIRMRASNQQ